jgi:major membrane immunogen (membrane-anchored lipoprotein)
MKKLLLIAPLALWLAACGAKEKDILIASKPEGAAIHHKGALLGRTPLSLKVKDPMELTLSKEGYANATLAVDGKSDAIQTVTLAPTGAAGAAMPYPNIRAAKTAYNEGKITESRYKEIKKHYEDKIDLEKNRLKTQYKAGKITESEYDTRVKAVKEKYE